jgi:hypothetical protein
MTVRGARGEGVRSWLSLLGLALGTLAIIAVAQFAHAQEFAEEAQVKAAYLHKFPGFVEWPEGAVPANPAEPYVIGVAGAEAIFSHLTRIAQGRLVQGRQVVVRRIADVKSAQAVHVLFIGRESARTAAAWIAQVRERPILTVVEDLGLQSHAILNFVVRDGTVRFEASLPAATEAGLKLSSRLLAVAAYVDAK